MDCCCTPGLCCHETQEVFEEKGSSLRIKLLSLSIRAKAKAMHYLCRWRVPRCFTRRVSLRHCCSRYPGQGNAVVKRFDFQVFNFWDTGIDSDPSQPWNWGLPLWCLTWHFLPYGGLWTRCVEGGKCCSCALSFKTCIQIMLNCIIPPRTIAWILIKYVNMIKIKILLSIKNLNL